MSTFVTYPLLYEVKFGYELTLINWSLDAEVLKLVIPVFGNSDPDLAVLHINIIIQLIVWI
jgi:hypothetical protein